MSEKSKDTSRLPTTLATNSRSRVCCTSFPSAIQFPVGDLDAVLVLLLHSGGVQVWSLTGWGVLEVLVVCWSVVSLFYHLRGSRVEPSGGTRFTEQKF